MPGRRDGQGWRKRRITASRRAVTQDVPVACCRTERYGLVLTMTPRALPKRCAERFDVFCRTGRDSARASAVSRAFPRAAVSRWSRILETPERRARSHWHAAQTLHPWPSIGITLAALAYDCRRHRAAPRDATVRRHARRVRCTAARVPMSTIAFTNGLAQFFEPLPLLNGRAASRCHCSTPRCRRSAHSRARWCTPALVPVTGIVLSSALASLFAPSQAPLRAGSPLLAAARGHRVNSLQHYGPRYRPLAQQLAVPSRVDSRAAVRLNACASPPQSALGALHRAVATRAKVFTRRFHGPVNRRPRPPEHVARIATACRMAAVTRSPPQEPARADNCLSALDAPITRARSDAAGTLATGLPSRGRRRNASGGRQARGLGRAGRLRAGGRREFRALTAVRFGCMWPRRHHDEFHVARVRRDRGRARTQHRVGGHQSYSSVSRLRPMIP